MDNSFLFLLPDAVIAFLVCPNIAFMIYGRIGINSNLECIV